MAGRALGIDLGGTKLLAVASDADGRPLQRIQRPTGGDLGPSAARALVCEVAREMERACGAFDAIGVGFPGLVDPSAGVARSSVILAGWNQVAFAALLAAELGCPVRLDNDVNNAARAELALRPGVRDLLFVAVGSGIGGAIVLDGRIWCGPGGAAGEIGHVSIDRNGPVCACGRRGCLGALASGGAIERELGIPAGSLASQFARGDERVARAVDAAGRALGIGIANALNLLDLKVVVIGGGVAEIGARFLAAIEAVIRSETMDDIAAGLRVEPARAGYDAGAIGAALLARERPAG